jgi:hypothetical protein
MRQLGGFFLSASCDRFYEGFSVRMEKLAVEQTWRRLCFLAKLPTDTAGNLNSYSKSSNSNNLRKQIFDLLDGEGHSNPLLSPKQICKLLDLSYKQYHNYVSKTKWEWKYYYKNERGSKCSSLGKYITKFKCIYG